MDRLLAAALISGVMLLAGPVQAQDPHGVEQGGEQTDEFATFVPGAQRLEGRLLAPCCWNQTIDIHGSPPANDMRREIRRRLRAGEDAQAIEDDIVARYGEKILAVPPGSPLKSFAVALSGFFVVAGVGAGFMLVRWRRRGQAAQKANDLKAGAQQPKRDAYDDQLDAELKDL